MDTNICLYCENPLEENSEFIGFCSTQCHDKEMLKTKIPTWAVLHSIHRRMHSLPYISAPRLPPKSIVSPTLTTPIQTSNPTNHLSIEKYPLLTSYNNSITTKNTNTTPMHLYLHTLTTKL
ncbi:hypothetical protein BC941DRAFT_412560 [Chlamydoabsidia padenii]|nr:hypothetical protein BC941DRAFT_412560 [Chlamydoabsidia padenii]